MAGSELNAAQFPRRSRTGCEECRRRHWKCNEAKPSCAYCQSVGRPCIYSRQLSWGGRPFKKSRFGRCLDSGAKAVSIADSGQQLSKGKGFIYTCSSKTPNDNPSRARSASPLRRVALEPLQNDVDDSTFSSEVSFDSPSLTATPALPKEYKPLFDYFIHGMTVSISCHKGIQEEICSAIVPMALQVPHILSATLALAAAHRQTSSLSEGDCQFELMRGRSLKQLRSALDQFNPGDNDTVLATTLLLCMAEVISPIASLSSWRSHLYGAATIYAQHIRSSGASVSSISGFLWRKYRALQAIALVCCSKKFEGRILTTPSDDGDAHIDDLAGYSTNLLPIFEEISTLEQAQEDGDSEFACDCPPGPPHFDCHSPLEHKSHLLFDRIRALMAQRKMSWTQSDGDVLWAIYHDLYLLDEAYHHMALLQVFRRGSLSVPLQIIDDSRKSILDCLTAITYQASPCPGVAALPPLFVAGTLCTDKLDRDKVCSLLKTMWMNYGMGNVKSCQTVLQNWWKQQDKALAKSTVLELHNLPADWDFLPY